MQVRMLVIVFSSIILSSCMSNNASEDQRIMSDKGQGKLEVLYTRTLPDGGVLKEEPTEVTLVKRRITENNVAAQVGLNVLLFALGGGVTVQPFSKDDLKGERINGLDDRKNILNPIPIMFIDVLQLKVNSVIQADAALRQKSSEKQLTVSGGSSRLVYEKLSGSDKERFRLKTELYVWGEKKGFHISLRGRKMVTCSESSNDLLTQDQWAENNYKLVKTRLDTTMRNCEKKVLAQLTTLLDG